MFAFWDLWATPCLVHLMSTILILVCSSFITKIMYNIKSDTLKCWRRAVSMLLNLEEPFYHCSCRTFLSLVYPENAALRWKRLICDLLTGPQVARLSGACQRPVLEMGKKPGVADLRKWPTSRLWEERVIHDTEHGRQQLGLVFIRVHTASVTAAVKCGLWSKPLLCLKGVS